jgi:hypothetical protein
VEREGLYLLVRPTAWGLYTCDWQKRYGDQLVRVCSILLTLLIILVVDCRVGKTVVSIFVKSKNNRGFARITTN